MNEEDRLKSNIVMFSEFSSKIVCDEFLSYLAAAEAGDMVAQYHLGLCYMVGQGAESDSILALKWLTLSAQQMYEPSVKLSEMLASRLTQSQLDSVRGLVADWVISRF